MYEEQIVQGDNYDKLSKTVCINILDFKYLKNDRFHNGYRLKELVTNEELTDTIEIHFIEIPKLKRIENSEEITDMLTAWVEFISNPESDLISSLEMSRDEIKEAKEELVRLSADSKERRLYEKRKESILNKVSALETAEQKGMEKGIKATAKNLISMGLDKEAISKATGLSIEEIDELK